MFELTSTALGAAALQSVIPPSLMQINKQVPFDAVVSFGDINLRCNTIIMSSELSDSIFFFPCLV